VQGAAAVYAINSSSFEAQVQEFIIVPGNRLSNHDGLTPKDSARRYSRTSTSIKPTGRSHSRAGRLANGSLVPVHFATVYDSAADTS